MSEFLENVKGCLEGSGVIKHPEVIEITGGGSAGGASGDIQFNNAGSLDGISVFTFDPATKNLSYSDLTDGPIVSFVTGGTGASVFLESGDNNQMIVEMSGGLISNQLKLQNGENNVGGGGIHIRSANASGSSFGILIEDADAVGGGGIGISSDNNGVSVSSPVSELDLNPHGGGISLTDSDTGGEPGISITSTNNKIQFSANGSTGILESSDITFTVASGGTAALLTSGTGSVQMAGDGGSSCHMLIGTAADHLGFFGKFPGATKETITGAKLASDVVMANLLTALAAYGLITDSTT